MTNPRPEFREPDTAQAYLTVEQAADRLRRSTAHVYDAIARGHLATVETEGGQPRIRSADLVGYGRRLKKG